MQQAGTAPPPPVPALTQPPPPPIGITAQYAGLTLSPGPMSPPTGSAAGGPAATPSSSGTPIPSPSPSPSPGPFLGAGAASPGAPGSTHSGGFLAPEPSSKSGLGSKKDSIHAAPLDFVLDGLGPDPLRGALGGGLETEDAKQAVAVAAGMLVARAEAAAAAQGTLLSDAEKYKAALLLAIREKQVGWLGQQAVSLGRAYLPVSCTAMGKSGSCVAKLNGLHADLCPMPHFQLDTEAARGGAGRASSSPRCVCLSTAGCSQASCTSCSRCNSGSTEGCGCRSRPGTLAS